MTTSSVYKNQALLKQVVADSYSLGECLRKLGLSFTGNSRVRLKAVITEYGIATDHFRPNGRSAEVKAAAAKPLAAHLALGSSISSYALKLKLWNAELLPRTCQVCGQGELWNARRLVLQLVWTYPLSKLAVKLGVSDTAIRKRCRRLGLALPPFGHWQRVSARNSAAD